MTCGLTSKCTIFGLSAVALPSTRLPAYTLVPSVQAGLTKFSEGALCNLGRGYSDSHVRSSNMFSLAGPHIRHADPVR